VGFEPTIPAFELGKTVHSLGRETNVTGVTSYKHSIIQLPIQTP
jgi:hypothetical protein